MKRRLRIIRRLDLALYRLGIRPRPLRDILRMQLVTASVALGCGALLWPLSTWIFWFGAGTALSCINFFSLTKHTPQLMLRQYTAGSGLVLFVRMQVRLLLTLFAALICYAWGHAPISALLAGLSMTVCGIVLWAARCKAA